MKSKLNCVLQIDLRNRSIHMEERVSRIEKYGSNLLAHSYTLALRSQIVVSENILNDIAYLSAIFLTKNTPPASFELAQ